jgi:hypothetical protein
MRHSHLVSKTAILLARRIAGAERDDWIRAMAAEWDAVEHGKTWWALGCLGGALRDRLRREWRPAALAVGVMPLIVAWNAVATAQIAPLLREAGATQPAWIIAYLLNPLPVAALLGYLVPRRARFLGLATGAMFISAPFLASALVLDVPVRAWLGAVGPIWLASYPVALGIWGAVAALAARVRQVLALTRERLS